MLGRPVPRLWKPTQSSRADRWCSSSHSRHLAGVAKNLGRMLQCTMQRDRPLSDLGADSVTDITVPNSSCGDNAPSHSLMRAAESIALVVRRSNGENDHGYPY